MTLKNVTFRVIKKLKKKKYEEKKSIRIKNWGTCSFESEILEKCKSSAINCLLVYHVIFKLP